MVEQEQQLKNSTSSTNTNPTSRQIPIVCPGHTRPLAELQFCYVPEENRTLLVSACHDRLPMMRDGVTGNWIGTFVGHKGAVWCCRLDPTGNLAATSSGDFSVQVWDAITGKSLYTFPHLHIVKTCDFSPDSRYLATGGHEGLVRIYTILQPKQEPKIFKVFDASTPESEKKIITISKVNWLNNTTIVVGCADGKVRIYDTPSILSTTTALSPIKILETQENGAEIRDMELSSTKEILTVASGSTVYFFDLITFTLIKQHKMESIHFRDEGGASLHPDCTKFIAGGSDLWVRVFDYETGAELECLKGHHGPIRCLRYSPDGTIYATGSEDGTIRLWTSS